MQYHNHVTQEPKAVLWSRCRSVEIDRDRLVCILDPKRKYDLTGAYRYRPHIDFLNLKSDDDLVGFVRWWGPLWLVVLEGGTVPEWRKSEYWNFQRRVRARLGLIDAFKSGVMSELRGAILEDVAADDEWSHLPGTGGSGETHDLGTTAFFLSLRCARKPDNHPKNWVPSADLALLRRAAALGIEFWSVSSGLSAAWRNGQAEIAWGPKVDNLREAIEWMFWHDIAGKRPLTFCRDCRMAFLPDSAHVRQYCTEKCAHRSAVRAWRRRSKNQPTKRRKRI